MKKSNHSISVVINTLNEDRNLANALESICSWVNEIIVVDMHSIDRTIEIAKKYGANIYYHKRIKEFDIARIFAVDKAASEWVLVLDADEVISSGLATAMIHVINCDKFDVVDIPRANFSFSGFPAHAFPEYHPRLFRKNVVILDRYSGKIHTFLPFHISARRTKIKGVFPEVCMLHLTNLTINTFITKINRYTQIEATQQYTPTTNNITLLKQLILMPTKFFLVHYIKKRGFMDGWRGFFLAIMFAFYQIMVVAKLWEMRLHSGSNPTDDEAKRMMISFINKSGGEINCIAYESAAYEEEDKGNIAP